VVLASLSTARTKGNDAAIRSDLSSIQTQAEIYYSNNNNYGTSAALAGSCVTAASLFVADTMVKNAVAAVSGINGANVSCYTDANPAGKYAIIARLTNDTTWYFCVDSSGNATTTKGTVASTACPL
jgi:hypothetical protein